MKQNKFLMVLKKNLSYLVVALCILAVGLSVVFVLLARNETGEFELSGSVNEDVLPATVEPETNPLPDVQPTVIPQQKTVSFIMPVDNPTEIETYSETMAYNSTLKRFSAHLATDFFANEGAPVYAAYDGVVESVDNSLLKGVTVVIDHGNGLKTVYNSLEDADDISVNAKVKQGDVIGHVSTSNRQECAAGAHLHFEVIENGNSINPAKYLVIEEK